VHFGLEARKARFLHLVGPRRKPGQPGLTYCVLSLIARGTIQGVGGWGLGAGNNPDYSPPRVSIPLLAFVLPLPWVRTALYIDP
jgi:hypothetical protein